MPNSILRKVDSFLEKVEQASFELELTYIKDNIRGEYQNEILNFKKALIKTSDNGFEVKITMDSDFDGYASAKALYKIVRLLGIPEGRIQLLPLSSLHINEDILDLENTLLLVSDTSYGHVPFKVKNCPVIWIDHHSIRTLDLIRARSAVGGDGVFLNTSISGHEKIRGLSCASFIYCFISVIIEDLGLNLENERYLMESFDSQSRLDCMLSLISDVMRIESYIGLIKGAYEANKPPLYEMTKGYFDFSNKRYFKSYIAIINNLIRRECHGLLEKVIKDEVLHDTVREIELLEEDKKIILKQYFNPCQPKHRIDGGGGYIEIYELPLAKNLIMRNYKGFLASIKTPKQGAFVTLSYYVDKGVGYFSCRTNADLDLKKYILDNGIKPIKMGGHFEAFGIELRESDIPAMLEVLKTVKVTEKSREDRLVKYRNLGGDYRTVCNLALYNEFHSEEISIEFEENDYVGISEEPRRTLYHIPTSNGRQLDVVSFDLGIIKPEIIAKPILKKSLYDWDCIDICEFS